MKRKNNKKWVAVSGGFDPIHIGHVRLMREAKKLGDELVVIVNNDHWLRLKKGFVFMPQEERVEIIRTFPFVDKVVFTDHRKGDADMSICRILRKLRPTIFANGGDRGRKNAPENAICRKLGIKQAYNVGRGGKIQSSSWMTQNAMRNICRSSRPWGEFYGWDKGKGWYLKTIAVCPNKRLSLQYHCHRNECWILVEGDATAVLQDGKGKQKKFKLKPGKLFTVPKKAAHRLASKKGGKVVEIAFGNFDENDIVRLEDDYGRIK